MPAKKRVRAPRRKRLDKSAQKAREAAIIADLKAGKLSYRLIAGKHKVSLPTVNAKARKANISRPRGRRPAVAAPMVAMAAKPAKRGRPRRVAGPVAMKVLRGRPRGRVAARIVRAIAPRGAFQNAFREMVLRFYPKLTLAQFDKLSKMIDKAVS